MKMKTYSQLLLVGVTVIYTAHFLNSSNADLKKVTIYKMKPDYQRIPNVNSDKLDKHETRVNSGKMNQIRSDDYEASEITNHDEDKIPSQNESSEDNNDLSDNTLERDDIAQVDDLDEIPPQNESGEDNDLSDNRSAKDDITQLDEEKVPSKSEASDVNIKSYVLSPKFDNVASSNTQDTQATSASDSDNNLSPISSENDNTSLNNVDITDVKSTDYDEFCGSDCKRFKTYMNSWPREKQPRAAICILVQASKLHKLKNMLETFDKYFNNMFKYPILLFHENDFEDYKDDVRNYTKSEVFFQTVKFTVPEFLPQPITWSHICGRFPLGYRTMCRFQAYTIFKYTVLKHIDYVWRLDDDSLLLGPVTYDIFKHMETNKYLYGYITEWRDLKSCVKGLWDTSHKFLQERNMKPQFELPEPKMYYNNFEVSATSLWYSPIYQEFIEYIDRSGGIYYHRWGDSPIKSIAVSFFVPKNKTHHFSDVPYRHRVFRQLEPPSLTIG